MSIDILGRSSDTEGMTANDPFQNAGAEKIFGKTIDGKTIEKPKQWWNFYNSTNGSYNGWSSNGDALTQFTDFAALNNYTLDEGKVMSFFYAKNLDVRKFAFKGSGGGGGGGKSVEQRQNDIQSILLEIENQAAILGIPKNKEAFLYIAKVAEKQSFSAAQLTKVVVGLADWKTLEQGTLLQSVDQFQQQGRNYFVNVDRKTARGWADKIANGSMSLESVEKLLQQQSKLANPWLADTIDQGINPSDLLSSSRSAIAKSLGIQVGEIDFSDSKWMEMVTTKDEKGVTTLADQNTIRLNVRKDERWANSDEARVITSNIGNVLASVFGMSAF